MNENHTGSHTITHIYIYVNKIVGIKVSRAYFFTICVIIFQHTGRIFIRYYAFYIYIISRRSITPQH